MMDWDNCDAAYDFEMEQRAIEADAMKLSERLSILGKEKIVEVDCWIKEMRGERND